MRQISFFVGLMIIFLHIEPPIVCCWEAKDRNLCGPLALNEICKRNNIHKSLNEICTLSGYYPGYGCSMLGLKSAAEQLGLKVVSMRLSYDDLKKINSQIIAFVDGKHFLIVWEINKKKVVVEEPPHKSYTISRNEFEKRWKGESLVFSEKIYASIYRRNTKKKIGSHINFISKKQNLGTIVEGKNVTVVFPFTNIGTEPLHIIIRSSCSCIETQGYKKTVNPSQLDSVVVNFKSTSWGNVEKRNVYIKTNDLYNKYVTLTISALIKKSPKIVPDNLWIENIGYNESIEKTVFIHGIKDDNFKVLDVISTEGVDISFSKCIDNKIPLTIKVTGGEEYGFFEKKIFLKTNDPIFSEIPLVIRGNNCTRLVSDKKIIFFSNIEKGAKKQILLHIDSDENYGIGSLKIEKSSPCINSKIIHSSQKKYKLYVDVNAPSFVTTIRDSLLIYIDDQKKPDLVIPIYAKIH